MPSSPAHSLMRLAAIAVVALGLAAPPAHGAEGALSAEERKAVEETVRQILRDKPEILLEAIEALREKQENARARRARAAIELERDKLERDPNTPVAGNREGDVTVVEFFDYQCGYCKQVVGAVQELIKSDRGIRVVFKEFPILGPESVFAARAALAAWRQDPAKYNDFHVALMSGRGKLDEERVMAAAAAAGLDVQRLKRNMQEAEITRLLEANMALANALGVNGTPAFVIGDRLVPGAIDIETFRKLIAEARKS